MGVAANRELYLRWLFTNHPTIYDRTVKPVLDAAQQALRASDPKKPMGDLIDDLTSSADSYTSSFDTPSLSVASDSGGSSIWDSLFSSIGSAASSLGTAYINTSAQTSQINLNTQRARQGLPPIDANGNIITSPYLAAQTGNYANLQTWLSKQGVAGLPSWAWMAGAGLGLLLLLRSRA